MISAFSPVQVCRHCVCCLVVLLSGVLLGNPPPPGGAVASVPASATPFAALLAPVDGQAPAVGANRLALLENGYDALLLRVHLIRQARRSIAIQTFIWTNDECGRLLMCELVDAARRGVKVRILADHMFSDQDPDVVAFLATVSPNLEVKHYRPATSRMKPSLWRTLLAGAFRFDAVNQRMHSKVMLFDEALLITGGRNIENTYFDHSTGLNFHDRDVLAAGPVVRAAADQFESFWAYKHSVPSRELVDVASALKRNAFRRLAGREDYGLGTLFDTLSAEADDPLLVEERFVARLRPVHNATLIHDSPGKSRGDARHAEGITRELRAVLAKARSDVLIQTPYLVLSPTARALLAELRGRNPGLKVRISTNSFASTDNVPAYSANYRQRSDTVRKLGLQVYELRPLPGDLSWLLPRHAELLARAAERGPRPRGDRGPFVSLHAKSLVVDDTLAFVGSYNLDPRSEHLNTEIGLLVEDAAFAAALRASIERALDDRNSWTIGPRRLPLGVGTVGALVDGLTSVTPLDLWPIENTSSFELVPGGRPLPPGDPDFHRNYRDVGSFPGTDGLLSEKEITTRLLKAVGEPLTPML